MKIDLETQRLREARENTAQYLLAEFGDKPFCRGRLSSSALSTSVAALAWQKSDPERCRPQIVQAVQWLVANQNSDGGWGDTPESPSNLATSLLVWSALHACGTQDGATLQQAEEWVAVVAGDLAPESITRAVLDFYGKDRTFSVPILTHCALAGVLGTSPWQHVPQLPFELAALPFSFFNFIRLPVVSYALPALIAIGLVRHVAGGRGGFYPLRKLRDWFTPAVLKKLERMQPASGGYLEAAPLTGFVAMSLSACGYARSNVVRDALRFLDASQREDGSLPIDSDLSLWLTTHAVRAFDDKELDVLGKEAVGEWIMHRQHRSTHAFNNARAGGWGWTDQPGAVPDADDTAGALLALRHLNSGSVSLDLIAQGVCWLLDMQNSDGGFPTFCKGWGTLPFDRSCPDITAHAIHALVSWREDCPIFLSRIDRATARALVYLKRTQTADGSWLPLWFGSQNTPGYLNHVVGTALVCVALSEIHNIYDADSVLPLLEKGRCFLVEQQNGDGGWGAAQGLDSGVEETALALSASCSALSDENLKRGALWLFEKTSNGTRFPSAPIGLYFASLWYDEKLYPVIFSLRAFSRLLDILEDK